MENILTFITAWFINSNTQDKRGHTDWSITGLTSPPIEGVYREHSLKNAANIKDPHYAG